MNVAIKSFVALLSAPVAVLVGLVAVMHADIARDADAAGLGLPMVVTGGQEGAAEQPGIAVPIGGSLVSLVIRKFQKKPPGDAGVVEIDLPLIFNTKTVSLEWPRPRVLVPGAVCDDALGAGSLPPAPISMIQSRISGLPHFGVHALFPPLGNRPNSSPIPDSGSCRPRTLQPWKRSANRRCSRCPSGCSRLRADTGAEVAAT